MEDKSFMMIVYTREGCGSLLKIKEGISDHQNTLSPTKWIWGNSINWLVTRLTHLYL